MCKFIFYAINNVLNENIIIFYFFMIIMSLKSQNAKKKLLEYKTNKKIVNVDNNEKMSMKK